MSDEVVHAIKAGKVAIIPTDTVYGLVTTPYGSDPVRRLYQLKGRPESQPSALMAASLDWLFECVPELRGRAGRIAGALLPGPYTLVLPNPARRFAWLCGDTPDRIGVRVPALAGEAQAVLDRLGAVASTSANLAGGPEPRSLVEVPEELRSVCVLLDGGELPGEPSTVIDFTGPEPVVLREGAGDVAKALHAA
ncbi:MAG TPA: L-threonylcarbamoyladenylate synthase [Gaiellaceae bacterium]|nr:L-threonylcarbamoyladenylate synthase [Gaiellaceae bacterium]